MPASSSTSSERRQRWQAGTSRRARCRSPRQESLATDARRVPSALALPAPPPLRSGGHGGTPPPPAARTAVLARAPAQFPTAGAGLALSAHLWHQERPVHGRLGIGIAINAG